VASGQRPSEAGPSTPTSTATGTAARPQKARAGSAEEREARKTLARVEKRLEQLAARESELNDEVLAHASDHERLLELSARLTELAAERDDLEAEWLEAAEALE
jgi:ATP-binding cassette subfamily F protein uup